MQSDRALWVPSDSPPASKIWTVGSHFFEVTMVGEYYDAAVSGARLRRRRPKARRLSLRDISKELATRGFFNELGKPYAVKSVASMLQCSIPFDPPSGI